MIYITYDNKITIVNNVLRYPANRQTDRQTNRRTDGRRVSLYLRNFVGGGNTDQWIKYLAQWRGADWKSGEREQEHPGAGTERWAGVIEGGLCERCSDVSPCPCPIRTPWGPNCSPCPGPCPWRCSPCPLLSLSLLLTSLSLFWSLNKSPWSCPCDVLLFKWR